MYQQRTHLHTYTLILLESLYLERDKGVGKAEAKLELMKQLKSSVPSGLCFRACNAAENSILMTKHLRKLVIENRSLKSNK